ncbi:MAG: ATP-binding protein [Phycisphaerales bacterium]
MEPRTEAAVVTPHPLTVAAPVALVATALLVLLGWMTGAEVLMRIRPGLVAMNPFTALCFITLGTGLWLARTPGRPAHAGAALGVVGAGVGLLRVAEYLLGSGRSFDHLLFPTMVAGDPPNHIAPNTAVLMVVAGFALATSDARPRALRVAREAAIVLLLLGAMLSLLGYLYGVKPFYGVMAFTPMALHTAACFMAAGLGLVLVRPRGAIASVILSPHLGGVLARRLLPVAVGVLVALSWARLEGERLGLYESAFGVAVLSVSSAAVMGALIWLNARRLNAADREQQEVRHELQIAQAELERLLDRRTGQLRESQRELEGKRALFETVLRQMPAAVIVAEAPSGKFLLFNERVASVLRHPVVEAGSIEDYGAYRGFHPDGSEMKPGEWPLARSIAVGEVVQDEEVDYLLGDGTRATLLINSAPVLDASGRIAAAVVAFTDITALKEAQREQIRRLELRQELDAARLAKTAMQETLGVVSHELRTPLACLRLLVESVLSAPRFEESQARTRLQSMETVAVSMGETLDSILDAARASAGRLTWRWERVNLRAVCADAQVVLSALARERGVRLETTIDDGAWSLRGDAGAVRRLMINLVSNACRHSRRGAVELRLSREIEGGVPSVVVGVSDYGDGMPPDILARLGDPFALAGAGVARGVHFGAGLGLSICRIIAAAHGGSISVASLAGVGTVVTARLRADLETPVEVPAPPPPVRIVDWPRGAAAAGAPARDDQPGAGGR